MLKKLDILLDDSAASHCYYPSKKGKPRTLSLEDLASAVEYAKTVGLHLNIFYGDSRIPSGISRIIDEAQHSDFLSIRQFSTGNKNAVYITDVGENEGRKVSDKEHIRRIILRCRPEDIHSLSKVVAGFMGRTDRIDIRLLDLDACKESHMQDYRTALKEIIDLSFDEFRAGKKPEIGAITDIFSGDSGHCGAGIDRVTLAPDGRLYLCPGFYTNAEAGIGGIGSIREGMHIPEATLLERAFSPVCRICEAAHCIRCVYMNRLYTDEINIPSEQQCVFSHLERMAGRELLERLIREGIGDYRTPIPSVEVLDPFMLLAKPRSKPQGAAPTPRNRGVEGKKPRDRSEVFSDEFFSGNPTREILEEFYSIYLENLRKLPYSMTWVDIDEIKSINAGDWELKRTDGITETNATGADAGGTETYWPLFVIQETSGYRVRDEEYRVEAYRELAAQGKWNKKLLVVTDKLVSDEPVKAITYSIPAPRILTHGFRNQRFTVYNNTTVTESPGIPYVMPYESEDGYSVAMVWSHLLQYAFFEYGERTGELIKPSPVINEVEAWKKWRGH